MAASRYPFGCVMHTALIAITAAVLFAANASAQVVALTRATLIDGTGAPAQDNITIVMEAGRIRDIGPSRSVAVPANATVIDLGGKFVVPGIINAHGHVGPAPRDPQLRQYALYGVTTTTSMAADPEDIVEFKARQQAGDLRGARILTVRYRFTTLRGNGDDHKTPEAARAKVDEIATRGADFIKVWIDGQSGRQPKLSREFVSAVFDQARRHGKPTMAHIVELDDARMVVDEGADMIVHNVRDQDIPADFIATLKAKKVSVTSTLAREEGMLLAGGGKPDDPFFTKGLSAEQKNSLARKLATLAADREHDAHARSFEQDKRNVRRLFDGGVRLGFGTDSGGALERFFIQGYYEHRQMELMVQAGFTPLQVIQSFSKNNAEMLGIDRDFGTLAKGKAADLLVLGRNPLDDITHMRTIEAVYLGGRKFE
jgi:imidazolonepropionase-like amidohydrolase